MLALFRKGEHMFTRFAFDKTFLQSLDPKPTLWQNCQYSVNSSLSSTVRKKALSIYVLWFKVWNVQISNRKAIEILRSQKFKVKKTIGQQKMWVHKTLGPEKVSPKIIGSGPRHFYLKKIWSKCIMLLLFFKMIKQASRSRDLGIKPFHTMRDRASII